MSTDSCFNLEKKPKMKRLRAIRIDAKRTGGKATSEVSLKVTKSRCSRNLFASKLFFCCGISPLRIATDPLKQGHCVQFWYSDSEITLLSKMTIRVEKCL
jgi:hypothetical protein